MEDTFFHLPWLFAAKIEEQTNHPMPGMIAPMMGVRRAPLTKYTHDSAPMPARTAEHNEEATSGVTPG